MQLVNEFDRINQQLKIINFFSCIVELNWRREISFYYNSLLSSWDVTPSSKPIEIQSVAMVRHIQMCADKIQCISSHTSCLFSWIFSLSLCQSFVLSPPPPPPPLLSQQKMNGSVRFSVWLPMNKPSHTLPSIGCFALIVSLSLPSLIISCVRASVFFLVLSTDSFNSCVNYFICIDLLLQFFLTVTCSMNT